VSSGLKSGVKRFMFLYFKMRFETREINEPDIKEINMTNKKIFELIVKVGAPIAKETNNKIIYKKTMLK
jgi:hypothetical protein